MYRRSSSLSSFVQKVKSDTIAFQEDSCRFRNSGQVDGVVALSSSTHTTAVRNKMRSRNNVLKSLASSTWIMDKKTLLTTPDTFTEDEMLDGPTGMSQLSAIR